jgi:predicted O-methyltransferase YrrM
MKGSIITSLPRYDRFLGGRGTLEIGYPWLSVGAIVALEQAIFRKAETNQPPKRVLEFGSGGSTVFFAQRAEYVESVESDTRWAPATRAELEKRGLADRVRLTSCTTLESMAWVAGLGDQSFDLLLVDHAADETITHRGERRAFSRLPLALVGLPKLRPTGWLVVDNYALHGMEAFDYTGWDTWIFDDLRYSGRGTLIARRRPGLSSIRGWPR